MSPLGLRALNRATLARQLLLRRRSLGVPAALEHLVGLQAQATDPPYLALLTRLDGYHPDQLVRLVNRRRAVRATLMRGTIHLVTARDALWLRPLVQPVLDRAMTAGPARAQVAALDREELVALASEVLDAGPVSNAELGQALRARWPEGDAGALAACARWLVPTVQVPPRGLWRTSGPVRHTSMAAWLGGTGSAAGPRRSEGVQADGAQADGAQADGAPGAQRGLQELVRRYLVAFGPASVADVQKWSGLQGLRPVVEGMQGAAGGLRRLPTDDGPGLWDVARGPLPDPATPAPVRLLPDFDNVLISYDDRERIIARDLVKQVFTVNGLVRPTVLVDGFVRALWTVESDRKAAQLVVRPFEPLPDGALPELRAEALRALEIAAPGELRREVVIRS